MKKLKLSICALLILSGLHVATPLQAAWYNHFWPQTRTQQILALAGLIAAGYLGQASYYRTGPFTQATPKRVQPSYLSQDDFAFMEMEKELRAQTILESKKEKTVHQKHTKSVSQQTVNSHYLEAFIQNLKKHQNHIKDLFSEKKPSVTIKKVQQYINKTVIPEIKTFTKKNADTITKKEKEILERLNGNLDWFNNQEKTITPKQRNSILQDVIYQEIKNLNKFHKQASVIKEILGNYRTELSDIKELQQASDYVESVDTNINLLLKEYQSYLSENNKHLLNNLSLGSFEVTESERLTNKDINAFIELINQTITKLK